MPRCLPALTLFAAGLLFGASAHAQHAAHGVTDSSATKAFLVEGLRVDSSDPPPGSAVGRAGARLPGGGYLHVVYGKPYARGRSVFGKLVSYDKVWVTGAHRSTELVVTVPVTVGGKPLEAGVYSLFTTPRADRWTLHLNLALGMHLADEYDAALDVLTVDATPAPLAEPAEAFTIDFVPAGDGADLRIRWDLTEVRVPIRPTAPQR